MPNAWKELEKVRRQAKTDLENTPAYLEKREAQTEVKRRQKILEETPQGKRVKLVDQIYSSANTTRKAWEGWTGILLGCPAGLSLCAATFKYLITSNYLESAEGPITGSVIANGALLLPMALGWYTGHRIGTARAEKFIEKELPKINP